MLDGYSKRINRMRMPTSRFAIAGLLLLLACAGGPPARYNPPQASLQQLQRQPDGHWRAHVRLQNFSTGTVEFNALKLKIRVQDGEWTPAASAESVKIGGNNAEILVLAVPFGPAAVKELNDRLSKSQPIRYTLSGSVRSLDPGRNNTLDYQGRLNPTPGLDGVFR
jgi:hypothetical protein